MASNPSIIDKYFTNSCVPIKFYCNVNDHYIDPCSCTSFYLCDTRESIIPRLCAGGTGFNHVTKTCEKLKDIVFNDICDQEKPWERCASYSGVDKDKLEQRCTNMAPDPKGSDGGVDGGLIAGVVIAVLIVAIIAVLLIIYVRKKGNPIRNLKRSRVWRDTFHRGSGGQDTSPSSAQRHGEDEETYAEIDDMAVYKDPSGRRVELTPSMSHTNEIYDREEEEGVSYDNPAAVYKDPSGRRELTPSMPHTNETYDREQEEGVVYDNPALKRDTPPPPEVLQVPLEYSGLEREQAVRSYSSFNEHNAATASDRNSKQPITGDDGYLVAEATGETSRNASPVDPTYFVIEKSEA
ncbi:hypothetical protein ACOMHN_059165 [Nucella lapillus]